MDIPIGNVDWNDRLQFDEKYRHALVTDVGLFQNCTMEQRDVSYAILNSSKDIGRIQYDIEASAILNSSKDIGRIQYDIEASKDLHTELCVVVVGRGSYEDELGLWNEKYYILVVRPTSVDGEYTRVGVGWIQSGYVVKQRLDVRIV